MKCSKCPLYRIEYSYGYDDCDETCLADYKNLELPSGVWSETGGCTRTNKWILSQDPEKLIDKHLDYEHKCLIEWEKYVLNKEKEQCKE